MKTQLIQALQADDKVAVFTLFLDPANYMLLHDTLIEECTIEICYFYVKALRLASESTFLAFAITSMNSTHGYKQLFHNILTLYNAPPYNLKDCHLEKDGIQPPLTIYANIARNILCK